MQARAVLRRSALDRRAADRAALPRLGAGVCRVHCSTGLRSWAILLNGRWPLLDFANAAVPAAPTPLPRDALQWRLPHNIWSEEGVQIRHTCPGTLADSLAYAAVRLVRVGTDLISGYACRQLLSGLDERAWLRRLMLLEAMTSVPGRFAEAVGSSGSLWPLRGEKGWIRTLIGDAHKSRMHLSIAMSLHEPRPMFRSVVHLGHSLLLGSFCMSFLASPRFCRSFVGYLDEEAVTAYTRLLEEMDSGRLPELVRLRAPFAARTYYRLPHDATLRDVFCCIRADELLAR